RNCSTKALAMREILKDNRGFCRVYGHQSRHGALAGYLRRRIASFADQVYPTIALARVAMALDDERRASHSILFSRLLTRPGKLTTFMAIIISMLAVTSPRSRQNHGWVALLCLEVM